MILEDFNSNLLKVKRVPQTASQTCMGQRLIRPLIEPIPYSKGSNNMHQFTTETIKSFGLTQEEVQRAETGSVKHTVNHVK